MHYFSSIDLPALSKTQSIAPGATPYPWNTNALPWTTGMGGLGTFAGVTFPYIQGLNGYTIPVGMTATILTNSYIRITGLTETPQAVITYFAKTCIANAGSATDRTFGTGGTNPAGTASVNVPIPGPAVYTGASISLSILAPNFNVSGASGPNALGFYISKNVSLISKNTSNLGILVDDTGGTISLQLGPFTTTEWSINRGDVALALAAGLPSMFIDIVFY